MLQQIANLGFQALWSPGFILFTLLLGVLYFWAIGPAREKFADSEPVTAKKKFIFLCGLFFFYIGYGGPLYLVGHLVFSVHMIQMAVSLLISVPLMLLGLPSWLIKGIVLKLPFRKAFRIFHNPLTSVVLFNLLFSFYHIPYIFDHLMLNKLLDDSVQVILFISALLMWWAIIAPVPEWNKLSELKRVGLIFLDGLLLTPACALIIFSNVPFYETYTNPVLWAEMLSLCLPSGRTVPPELFEQFMWLPLLEDQRLGGVVMKIIQELIYGIILGYVFFQWVRRERSEEKQEELDWMPNQAQ